MSAKHTPGPWHHEEVPTSIGSCHKIGPFVSAGVRKETWACVYADRVRVGEMGFHADTLRANARLIAAAPDLLAALQHLEDLFRAIAREEPVDVEAALAIADKAIGRAEGSL